MQSLTENWSVGIPITNSLGPLKQDCRRFRRVYTVLAAQDKKYRAFGHKYLRSQLKQD
jgi:hypothetical protein